jgi:hypothetical protein
MGTPMCCPLRSNDDKIAWYENLGGGAFGSQQVITTEADEPTACSPRTWTATETPMCSPPLLMGRQVAWYENLKAAAPSAASRSSRDPGRRGRERVRHGPGR